MQAVFSRQQESHPLSFFQGMSWAAWACAGLEKGQEKQFSTGHTNPSQPLGKGNFPVLQEEMHAVSMGELQTLILSTLHFLSPLWVVSHLGLQSNMERRNSTDCYHSPHQCCMNSLKKRAKEITFMTALVILLEGIDTRGVFARQVCLSKDKQSRPP